MVQGTERIQDFIRQASSLHAVNTVYALGLSVVLIFCYHLVSSSGAAPPGELGAVTYATVALFAFKFLMQVSTTLQKLLKDEEFGGPEGFPSDEGWRASQKASELSLEKS